MTAPVSPAPPASRAPGFFWQGWLILLPVLILAGFGLYSIRQDKALAQREAAERASTLAEEAAESIWSALTAPAAGAEEALRIEVDATGHLRVPVPVEPFPAPAPLPLSELTEAERAWWETLRAPTATVEARLEAGRQLAGKSLSPRWLAVVRFRWAGLLVAAGRVEEARALYASLGQGDDEWLGETGLPIAPLARWKAVELMPAVPEGHRAAAWGELVTNALARPDSVTPLLLAKLPELGLRPADTRRWQSEWDRQELLRSLHATAFRSARFLARTNDAPVATLPRFVWFSGLDADETLWLAARVATNGTGSVYQLHPSLDVRLDPDTPPAPGVPQVVVVQSRPRLNRARNILQKFSVGLPLTDPLPVAVRAAQVRMPAYFGLTLDIAGRTLIGSNRLHGVELGGDGKGSGRRWMRVVPARAPDLLAQARRWDHGVEALRVGVHLVGPGLLYERQRSRAYLFGLLILAAAVTGVIGFLSARRAYLRQQQLSELKSNFVSSVSHELRAPIASVRLMAENLEHGRVPEPERRQEYFRFIVQECRRLGTLIENVLDFARIEQGRKQYDFEPTDVFALVRRTVQLMEPVAVEKQVRLVVARPSPETLPGEPHLDGPAVQQALINLIDNAIKHSPAGAAVTVTVGLDTGTVPATLRFSVGDEGPGIPAGEQERIFDRFYRRGPEMRRETQGVGIGLSIVRHIAEAHGGRVRVESAEGQGSRFHLELPWRIPTS